MKPKFNPNFPSTPILIIVVLSGLIALAVGLSNIATVREGLATGRVNSMGIIFNDQRMIYKSDSPIGYWTMMGLISFGCGAGLFLGTCGLILIIKAYMKKRARRRNICGSEQ
jgi:Zn-dependent protease